MSIQEIQHQIEHRPWAMPQQAWKYYQEWNRAVFLHWKVEHDTLRKWVPDAIEIDLFDGVPWISLVAFTMEKIRPRYLPPFSPISNFDEINIRTYVKAKGKTAVYFLSIEGGKRLSCQVARSLSELPYRYSKIKRKGGEYTSRNEAYGDQLEVNYQVGESVPQKTALDKWLTERYALIQDGKKTINQFEIQHKEWDIKELKIDHLLVQYPRFNALINKHPDLTHYSPGVQVISWDKTILQ
jgi:uncharacterized protein YqjF (DUF2071 family)